MKSIYKLEKMIESWLKPVPHLPTEWRKWLADNAWWLTIIGVVLSTISVLGMLIKLMAIMSPEFNYRFVHIYI